MNAPAKILSDGDDAFRLAHVGASEVAALFDASPYLTHFELWHRKKGNVSTPDFMADGMPNNARIEAGIRLEPAIIEWACDRWDYIPQETPKNLSNGNGLGGHPDKCVICPKRGPGILEIKTADWLVAKKWGDEPPLHYLLQSQSYQGLAKVAWGDVIVLVGGNDLQRHCYEFRPAIFAEIEKRVAAFWQSVRDNDPPSPDYSRDRDTISSLFDDPDETVIDLTLDNRAAYAAADYLKAAAAEKAAKEAKDAAAAELLDKLGNNGCAKLDGYTLRAPLIAAVPERTITPEMVGEKIPGRRAYRRIYLKERT
jgi:predicted phage-related endonuclease